MIAATYERIGAWVVVEGVRTGKSAECLVVDVPAQHHRRAIERKGIAVEVAAEWAVPLCGSAKEPPRLCPVIIRRIQ